MFPCVQYKALTSDLSFTIIGKRKVTLLCVEVVMTNDTKEKILAAALEMFSQNAYYTDKGCDVKDLAIFLGIENMVFEKVGS